MATFACEQPKIISPDQTLNELAKQITSRPLKPEEALLVRNGDLLVNLPNGVTTADGKSRVSFLVSRESWRQGSIRIEQLRVE